MRRPPLPEDIQELLILIRHGKLFAIQDWIKAGKRIRDPENQDYRANVLDIVVETGFHALVEVLLRATAWTKHELSNALETALNNRRSDLVELFLQHGTNLAEVDFETICHTMDVDLMARFLRDGGDPSRDNAFSRALSRMKARPLLRFYRSFRAEYPALDDQAAWALAQAVDGEQVRWAALLVWAGADPFRPVPYNDDDTFPVDPDLSTTAADKAVWRSKPELIKVLKLKPTPEQALELLPAAAYNKNMEIFRDLLKSVSPASINKSDRNSCEALERLVGRGMRSNIWTNVPTNDGEVENLEGIQLLVDRGARWRPEPKELRYVRRHLSEHDGRYIVQVIRLLLYTRGAAELSTLIDFCDSPKMRAKIAEADAPLGHELAELRKKLRRLSGGDAKASTETVPGVEQAAKNNERSDSAPAPPSVP